MTNPELTTTPAVLVEGPGLRLCGHCFHLLQTRKHMQDTQKSRPPIVKLYELLRETVLTTYPDIELFFKVIVCVINVFICCNCLIKKNL